MKNHLQPQITEHKKRTTKYCTENPGPGLGWAQKHGKWDPNPPLVAHMHLRSMRSVCILICYKNHPLYAVVPLL